MHYKTSADIPTVSVSLILGKFSGPLCLLIPGCAGVNKITTEQVILMSFRTQTLHVKF